jgi:hypothetical protein
MCLKYCQRRPRSGAHLFCSKRCAAEAKQKKLGRCVPDSVGSCLAHPVRRTVFADGMQESGDKVPRGDVLELLQPAPRGVSWHIYVTFIALDGDGHRSRCRLALKGCIYCRAVPYIGDYFPLCTSCDSYLVGNAGPFLLSVPQDHTTYWAGGSDRHRVGGALTVFEMQSWTSLTPLGRTPRNSLRSGWCTGSYPPQTCGTITGHIGRRVRGKFRSQALIAFSGMCWRRKGVSPPRGGTPVTSSCSGMERRGPATSENPGSIRSALTRSVPFVRSPGDRSTWRVRTRAFGSDTGRGFTRPRSRQSQRGFALASSGPLFLNGF